MSPSTPPEPNISRNYVDHVRSMMLATSGVETAVARLTKEVRDRYRVHFRPGVRGTRALSDTLVFADIKITSSKGPRFLSWAWVMQ